MPNSTMTVHFKGDTSELDAALEAATERLLNVQEEANRAIAKAAEALAGSRMVEVPAGCKAVFVSDQLVEMYADWRGVDRAAEARAVPTDNPLVIDVQTRYA